jgi:glycerol-3-phosphate acyltransferase PlsY
MELALIFLYSYLIGSIPFGLIFTKLFSGRDVRKSGSKNIGATNALRTGGKFSGVMTFLFDFAKGYFPVIITVNLFAFDNNYYLYSALFCFMGHLYPVWLKFRGGKGVATFFGILLALSMNLFFLSFLVALMVIAKFKYVSLGSIIGALSASMIAFFMCAPSEAFLVIGLSFIIILRHKENLEKLLKNTENRIKF